MRLHPCLPPAEPALLPPPLQGVAWNVGHCAAGLISRGEVPPFVVVAVDSAGPMRSLNYLPYKPGVATGVVVVVVQGREWGAAAPAALPGLG